MRTLVNALILVPISALVLLLALANRSPVLLSLDPFSPQAPAFAVTVPLFEAIFGGVVLGLLIGWAATWWTQGHHRRAARFHQRAAERLRAEAESLRADAAQPARGASGSTPGLPAPLIGRRAV